MVLSLWLVQSYVGMVCVIIISVFPQKKSARKDKSSTVTHKSTSTAAVVSAEMCGCAYFYCVSTEEEC